VSTHSDTPLKISRLFQTNFANLTCTAFLLSDTVHTYAMSRPQIQGHTLKADFTHQYNNNNLGNAFEEKKPLISCLFQSCIVKGIVGVYERHQPYRGTSSASGCGLPNAL
jgi:hypothetical protein